MKLINCTPHPLNIHTPFGIVNLPKGENIPRLIVNKTPVGHLIVDDSDDMIPIVGASFGEIEGLPKLQDRVCLIVSALVATHPSVADRGDLFYLGEPVRDHNGNITGCQGLYTSLRG